ncbi:MAG: hypothetical protein ACI9KE_004954 [Polyangiales bacterium]
MRFTHLGLRFAALTAALALSAVLLEPASVEACGCFTPPEPTPEDLDYAVNQESEMIIFEVGETTVSAHVLIRYQGKASTFAWIVPVPNAPELELSETFAFAFLDQATRPRVDVEVQDLCPSPNYECAYHDPCPFDGGWGPTSDAAPSDAGPSAMPTPVDVLGRETIGAYETITFAAGDAAAAVAWLREEGFLVNATSAPFMQPYADAGMVFVAARLVAGADVDELRPLKMTYEGTVPMIPLRLTAVGTQPELTVTSFIFSNNGAYYAPVGHPLIDPTTLEVSGDPNGRTNYPMILSRAIDEAGGDAFIIESAANPPRFSDTTNCCREGDRCRVANNDQCECPLSEFDAADCAEEIPGMALVESLADRYGNMTRITTRLSAEEMTFDPMFEPSMVDAFERLELRGERESLERCAEEIVSSDRGHYVELRAQQFCATTYCGHGTCASTGESSAGCDCDEGYVARSFSNLDGEPSVTCVPDVYPVDFSGPGVFLPDACADFSCGLGTCVDVGGFPTCRCAPTAAGTLDEDGNAVCQTIRTPSESPGASVEVSLETVFVCAPRLPRCRSGGWLVVASWPGQTGRDCGYNVPSPFRLTPRLAPNCNGVDAGPSGDVGVGGDASTTDSGAPSPDGMSGCGCTIGGAPSWPAALLGFSVFLIRRSSRRSRR